MRELDHVSGVNPPLPDQDGDTNADGCTEIVVTSPWGIGVLEQVGNTMSGLVRRAEWDALWRMAVQYRLTT